MASLHFFFCPVVIFSTQTSIKISIEELNERETFACKVRTSPNRMGWLKDTLLTEAVTTTLPQCRCAEIAEAISIQCKSRPPIRFPREFVSLGNTISVSIAIDSLAVLDL